MEFEDIVRRYQKQLYVVAYHYLQNQHDAEDAVQEVFLRLLTLEKAFTAPAGSWPAERGIEGGS